MGLDVRVVEWLNTQGHDARHLSTEGLHRASDERIFSKAAREDRTIITFDLDFGEIVARTKDRKPSVLLFRVADARRQKIIDRLKAVITAAGGSLEAGAVVVIEDTRHRVRLLPIGRTEGTS